MRTYIDDPKRWDEIGPARIAAVPKNLEEQVSIVQKATDASQYFLPNPIKRSDFPKLSPRTDPKIFSPVHLVVHPVIGPLAVVWKNPNEQDPLTVASLDQHQKRAAPPKVVPPKKKKAVASEDGYMPGAEGMPTKKAKKSKIGGQIGSGSEINLSPDAAPSGPSGSMPG